MTNRDAQIALLQAELAAMKATTEATFEALTARIDRHERQPIVIPDDSADPVSQLRLVCARLGVVVAWDGTICERDAALVLHRSPRTLKNWRNTSRPMPFVMRGNRAWYALAVVADFRAKEKNAG